MPRSKFKVKQTGPNVYNLQKAVQAVLIEKCSLGEACKLYDVKKTTLYRQVQKLKKTNTSLDDIKNYAYKHNRDVKKIFDEHDEKELITYMQNISAKKYGLSKKKLRQFVYKYAIANNLSVPPEWIKNEQS